jgi:hypothetical protein
MEKLVDCSVYGAAIDSLRLDYKGLIVAAYWLGKNEEINNHAIDMKEILDSLPPLPTRGLF